MDAIWTELYNAAKEVQNPRQISDYVSGGEVAAIMPDGKCGAPCGACRELMVQLMPKTYKGIEILMDYENEKIIKLGDITPEWWIGE